MISLIGKTQNISNFKRKNKSEIKTGRWTVVWGRRGEMGEKGGEGEIKLIKLRCVSVPVLQDYCNHCIPQTYTND